MEQNYFVNPLELAIAAATAAGSGAIAGVCLFLGRFLSALVFLAIALLFFKIALDAGAKISVGKDGVSRRLLGKTKGAGRLLSEIRKECEGNNEGQNFSG